MEGPPPPAWWDTPGRPKKMFVPHLHTLSTYGLRVGTDEQLYSLGSYPDFVVDHGIMQLPGKACPPGQHATWHLNWTDPDGAYSRLEVRRAVVSAGCPLFRRGGFRPSPVTCQGAWRPTPKGHPKASLSSALCQFCLAECRSRSTIF